MAQPLSSEDSNSGALRKANWLGRYLDVEHQFDDKLKAVLSDALTAIDDKFGDLTSDLFSAKVRRAQIAQSHKGIRSVIKDIFGSTTDLIKDGQQDAAVAAVDASLYHEKGLLSKIFSDPDDRNAYANSLRVGARRNIEAVVTRVVETELPLSKRVYKTQAMANGQVTLAINRALARGDSAKDLAKSVQNLINPDVPGGISYAARRLGRTELNNAFHAQSIHDAQDSPWVQEMEWHLSKVHKSDPGDECEDYAQQQYFPVAQVPKKPHPNCRCYATPKNPDLDTFEQNLLGGQYDSYLDSIIDGTPPSAQKQIPSALTGKDATSHYNPIKRLYELTPPPYDPTLSDKMNQYISDVYAGKSPYVTFDSPADKRAAAKIVNKYQTELLADSVKPAITKIERLVDKTIPESLEAAENSTQVSNWLKSNFTGLDVVDFDRKGIDIRSAREIGQAFVEHQASQPNSLIRKIRIGEVLDDAKDSESASAITIYDPETESVEMVFNERLVGDYDAAAQSKASALFRPKGKRPFHSGRETRPWYSTFTHEWGHVLDYSGRRGVSRGLDVKAAGKHKIGPSLFEYFDPEGQYDPTNDDDYAAYESWFMGGIPSKYSFIKGNDSNLPYAEETVAEAYRDVFESEKPTDTSLAIVNELKNFIAQRIRGDSTKTISVTRKKKKNG